jgi:hypothetical protein
LFLDEKTVYLSKKKGGFRMRKLLLIGTVLLLLLAPADQWANPERRKLA